MDKSLYFFEGLERQSFASSKRSIVIKDIDKRQNIKKVLLID